MHSNDIFIQQKVPTIAYPKFGPHVPIEQPGHRFLVGANGLWLELRRPWLYVVRRVAESSYPQIPYGNVREELDLPPLPASVINQFALEAKEVLPNESAASIFLSQITGEWRLEMLQGVFVNHENFDYRSPPPRDDETLVIDIHSHGFHPAFFSDKDDHDDKDTTKIAAVIGFTKHSDGEIHCKAKFRLCLNGIFISMLPYRTNDQIQLQEQKNNGTYY